MEFNKQELNDIYDTINSYMDSVEDDEYSEYDNEPTFEKMKSNKKGGIE